MDVVPARLAVRTLLRVTVASVLAASCAVGCSRSPDGSDIAQRRFAWAMSHGGCECGPAAFPSGDSGATGYYAREVDDYVRGFLNNCRRPQVLVVAYGDGTTDVADDLTLARARASALVRRLAGKRPWKLDAIWFGGPGVRHASTAQAMCLPQRIPPELRT
jgi:hypothetical protein